MLINLRRSYCSGSLFVISTTRGALPGVDIQYLFIDFFELMIMRRKGDNSRRVFLAKAPWLIGKTFELEEGSRTATDIIDGHYKWSQLNENQFYLVKMGTGWDSACEIWDCQEQTHLLAGGFIFTKEAATLHVIEVTTGHSILLLDSVGSSIFDFNVDLLP
ncbi:hypothetical protein Pelo_19229 [Pelomyxa schiedti]|nr:hypothetical protein Pelo_19229 [Pelomyxa schiedti]